MEIKIELKNTVEDLQNAYIVNIEKQRPLLYVFNGIFIVGPIAFIIIQICQSYPLDEFFLLMLLLSYGIYRLVWLYTLGRRGAKKNPGLLDDISVKFDDDGLHIHTKVEESRIKWEGFSKAHITHKVILLYPNETMFYFFPKRNFTDSEYAQLSKKIKQNIKT